MNDVARSIPSEVIGNKILGCQSMIFVRQSVAPVQPTSAKGGGTLVAHDGAGNVGQKRLMFEALPDRCYIIYNSICGSG